MNQISVIESDAVVATMNRARLALTEAKSIQETKRIVDAAAAAEIYAKRQKLGEEASDLALSIKIEALRKLGEMLQAAPRNEGMRLAGRDSFGGTKTEPPKSDAPTLADLGLTKKESAVAQKLANLSEEEFDQVRSGATTVSKAVAAIDTVKTATTAQKVDPVARLKARVAELERELEEARTFQAGAEDAAAQAVETAANLQSLADGEEFRRIEILTAKLRASEARKNELMNENAALKRQIKAMQRAEKRAA